MPKITEIRVYQVELPLNEPYRLSGGRLVDEQVETTIVSVATDVGITGWGEGCPWGARYLPAFTGGVRAGIKELAPALLGQNPFHIDQINRLMDFNLSGHWYVKSALDMACWDLLGKYTNQPLYTLLGGYYGDDMIFQSAIYTGAPDEMAAHLKAAQSKGYTHFSAKIGGDVFLDIERIRALVDVLQPGEQIIFDANRSWLPGQAIQVMNAVKDVYFYFEQPCETLDQCLTVRRFTQHPLILDESILSFDDLLQAQQLGIAQGIGLKIGRVGGLTKARRMRDFCVATGIRMNIEETGGSQIAHAANIHLAISTPEESRHASIDFVPLHSIVTADSAHQTRTGKAFPSAQAGLGITPRMETLAAPIAVYA